MDCLLAIDQGTTSTRCILFDRQGQALHSAQRELDQHFPADGWVEHDAEEIRASTLELLRSINNHAAQHGWRIAGIGITGRLDDLTACWQRDTAFAPKLARDDPKVLLAGWRKAVDRVRS